MKRRYGDNVISDGVAALLELDEVAARFRWVRDANDQGGKEYTLPSNKNIVDGHGSFNEEGRSGQEKRGTGYFVHQTALSMR